ncbi:MAG: ATP-binding protein [Bacteroidales bacterium]
MTDRLSIRIAVASGKGGTGKTLVATNLAALISLRMPVVLADLDVEEPNASVFVTEIPGITVDQSKLIPEWDQGKCTLCTVCSTVCRYHAVVKLGEMIVVFKELCHSCHACSELCPTNALPMRKQKIGTISTWNNKNFILIESRLEIGEEQAVPLIRLAQQHLRDRYDKIPVHIYDCPPGTSCPVVASVKEADYVILVTEPTPFGLNDLRLAVETMRKLEKPFGVVINRHGIGDASVETYCNREGIRVLTRISFDRDIARHYSRGELIYDKIGHFTDALMEIMSQLGINR